ncbi:cobalamin-binding protein [Aromatoleum sp.]|uniref:cobalamin-binding protein n=1 Tax=Aromatoleum sp. TaxID=2307007 RepID=UPI002FC932E8
MPLPKLFPFAAALAATVVATPLHAELAVVDDAGRTVRLARPAQRVVSLAPHVTELLFAAGAGPRVVGAVAYSDYPEAARQLPRVGGYGNIDMEAVAALKPDLVIAWKTGNRDAHLDKLAALGIAVYLNEPRSLDDVARSLESLGVLAGSEGAARAAADAFRARRDELARRYGGRPRVRMFYQIWDKPLMTINDEHLISDAIRLCGGDNVFGKLPQLAPAIGVESVLAADPEVIVASGMGEARPDWLDQWKRWPKLAAAAADNLYFIPPELIQRHTPRLLDGAAQLCSFLDEARAKRRAGSRDAKSG